MIKKLADAFTRQDIDRLLKRAADRFRVTQSWTIKMEFFEGRNHLCVYWTNCLLEENAKLVGGYWSGIVVDDWWFMQEDGTWFRIHSDLRGLVRKGHENE